MTERNIDNSEQTKNKTMDYTVQECQVNRKQYFFVSKQQHNKNGGVLYDSDGQYMFQVKKYNPVQTKSIDAEQLTEQIELPVQVEIPILEEPKPSIIIEQPKEEIQEIQEQPEPEQEIEKVEVKIQEHVFENEKSEQPNIFQNKTMQQLNCIKHIIKFKCCISWMQVLLLFFTITSFLLLLISCLKINANNMNILNIIVNMVQIINKPQDNIEQYDGLLLLLAGGVALALFVIIFLLYFICMCATKCQCHEFCCILCLQIEKQVQKEYLLRLQEQKSKNIKKTMAVI